MRTADPAEAYRLGIQYRLADGGPAGLVEVWRTFPRWRLAEIQAYFAGRRVGDAIARRFPGGQRHVLTEKPQ
jgi:hypothetical protein